MRLHFEASVGKAKFMPSNDHFSRRKFLSGAGALVTAGIVRPALAFTRQDPVANTPKDKAESREKVSWKALPFSMKEVRLLPGPFEAGQERNRQYLHSLPNDRLVHSFRLTAGLQSSAQPFGGWEKPDSELRGHFCGGHYLSGVALTYASTGDEDLKKKGDVLVQELARCQDADKSGYLSAFPVEFFDRLRDRVRVWAPFYTIHKVMAGLLDMHQLADNPQALDVVEKMAKWVDAYTGSLPYEHMQRILNTEYGGMGEVLANMYAATGNSRYIEIAKRFDKKLFFDPLAEHRDELRGLHANTHIPQVIAAARLYELTRDLRYRDIAQYFWDEIHQERMYANGGTSNGERWLTDPGKLSHELGPSSTEDCCAYNQLKLTRHVFAWNPSPHYMDYYERTLFNHRLGTMDPETGTTMYYYPQGVKLWKTYGTPTDSFWCCSGTGVEEFGKFTDTIYFHDDNSVYVNLFIASELNWQAKNFVLRQETDFPRQQGTKLTIASKRPTDIEIHVRIPNWTKGGSVKVNGRALPVFASAGSYLTLRGPWKPGDTIEVGLPMGIHSWRMPDDDTVQAPMYGPLLLAAKYEDAPKDKWYGETGPFERRGFGTPPPPLPGTDGKLEDATTWVQPAGGNDHLSFQAKSDHEQVTLVPINSILHERYDVYWKITPPTPRFTQRGR
jgi:DUF1680 family protein